MAQNPEAEKQRILERSPFTRSLVTKSPMEMKEFEDEYMAATRDLEQNFMEHLGSGWRRIYLPPLIFTEAGFEAFQLEGDVESRKDWIISVLFSGFELGMENVNLFVGDVEEGLRSMYVTNSCPKIMGGRERITDCIRTLMKIGAYFREYTPNAGAPLSNPADLGNP